MLNIFAATAFNNCAKTCRMYLQSIISLGKDHPHMFRQFMLGNHTAKHTEKIWSSILTDLSIGQVLMKSPKERGGVIRKEMTDVLRVWTKTMHRCEKISECLNVSPQQLMNVKHTKKCNLEELNVIILLNRSPVLVSFTQSIYIW